MTKSGSNLFQQNPMIYFRPSNIFFVLKKVKKNYGRTLEELITVSEPQKNLLSQLLSTFVSGHCTKLGIFFQQKVSFKKYYSYLETAMLEQQFENV